MFKFNELNEELKLKYKDIFIAMFELDNNEHSLVLPYEYNNKEKVLQINGDICRIWEYLSDNDISYSEFMIDDNFDLSRVALDDAILLEEEGETYFQSRKTNCLEDFNFVAKEEKDLQGYDGIAVYSQYNEYTDIRVDLMYQHMQKPDNRVYPMHLKNPIEIAITKKASKKVNKDVIGEMYARLDFDATKNYRSFKIATINDFGLLKTFNKDLVALQKTNKISRYYKVVAMNKNNELQVAYPFGPQYKLEEILNYIEKLGFNKEVPSYLVEMHNQENKEYLESIIVAANLKALNKAYIKEKGHSLKLVKEL